MATIARRIRSRAATSNGISKREGRGGSGAPGFAVFRGFILGAARSVSWYRQRGDCFCMRNGKFSLVGKDGGTGFTSSDGEASEEEEEKEKDGTVPACLCGG